MTSGTKVIGYVRVSTDAQGTQGASLEAQRQAIRQECDRRGWDLIRIEEDVASGKKTNGRLGLARAVESCESGEADGLVAAKLDRITRSLLDFAQLTQSAQKSGYDLVVIDQGFDLSTPNGRAMAGMLAVFAESEREMISARTKNALAITKAQGVRLGRPPTMDPKTRQRIARERKKGKTLAAIAEGLNKDGIATAQGGKRWYASTISKALR